MKLVYSARSLADLRRIAAKTRDAFGSAVAAALESRFRAAISQICEYPESAPRVERRKGVHVLSLARYPYRIFYRAAVDEITLLHIRHTSRRSWRGG